MFIVSWRPLVAVVVMTGAKEEILWHTVTERVKKSAYGGGQGGCLGQHIQMFTQENPVWTWSVSRVKPNIDVDSLPEKVVFLP